MAWWNGLSRNTKIAVGVGGVAGIVLIWRYYKNKQAASSSSTSPSTLSVAAAPTSSGGGGTPPTSTISTPGGGSYSGPPSDLNEAACILSGGTWNPTTSTCTPAASTSTSTTGTSTPTPGTSSPANPGYGTITINGQQYIVLGPAGGAVYQVTGGAPVYFGNANGVAQGSAAEANAAKQNGYAYTPVQYAPFVAPTPSQVGAGQF